MTMAATGSPTYRTTSRASHGRDRGGRDEPDHGGRRIDIGDVLAVKTARTPGCSRAPDASTVIRACAMTDRT